MRTTATTEYRKVRLKDIVVREPIRTHLDPAETAGLAEDMKKRGLLEPIVVRPEGEKMVLVAGLRRTKAAEKLGWDEIDAHVVSLEDVDAKAATLAENIHREDLSPLDRARAIQAYIDVRRVKDPNLTQEVLGKELGVKPSEVSNTLLLLKQEVHVQKLVEDGRLSPGHIEHVIGPLAKELPKEAVVKFAHEIAGKPEVGKPAADIRTAKADMERLLERYRTEVAQEAAVSAARKAGGKAKFDVCPVCYGDRGPEKFFLAENRPVLEHKAGYYGDRVHRWYADTGEAYLTPAELKEAERQKTAGAKARQDAAKARKKKGEGGKVLRDYAVFLSRATADQWAQGLLNDATKQGLVQVRLGDVPYASGRGWIGEGEQRGLHVDAGRKLALPQPIVVTPLPGDGFGVYKSRVQFGSYASLPSRQDNVAERADVKDLRADRAKLIGFQVGPRMGVKQDGADLWPAELGGFKRGERVKLGPTCEPKGYAGKEAVIVAFDVIPDGRSRDARAAAVFDVPWPSKVHALSTLAKVTKFACAKCGRPALVVVQDGKPVRVCNGPCALPEGKCTCPPAKKGKAPKGRAT